MRRVIIKVEDKKQLFEMQPATKVKTLGGFMYVCDGCHFSTEQGCKLPSRVRKPDCLPIHNKDGLGFIYKLISEGTSYVGNTV